MIIPKTHHPDFTQLAHDIKCWGHELGFQQIGISDIHLEHAATHLQQWLEKKYHGTMYYMEKHGKKRTHPQELVPNTFRIISVRMDYLVETHKAAETLKNPTQAYIARYALGRDYHKVLRKRLQQLAKKINTVVNDFYYRAFVDSAPVLEKPIAQKAGLGWQGKNTLILNKKAGSWFFLGEIYTNLPLPLDKPARNHCGSCTACLDICPTKAFVAPYQLDARRCISYLTIENRGIIPEEFRDLIGNRIFGCDDCQIVCPWNKFARYTSEKDFQPRHGLESIQLLELFSWSEEEFLRKTQGSAIRRAGYFGWLRNIAVALGNAPKSPEILSALQSRQNHSSDLVQEHIDWAIKKQSTDI